jgi:brefeldin A-inhibited guanine nucleotide-exchange protein
MPTPIPDAAQVSGEEGAAAAAPVEAKEGDASTEEAKEGGAMVAAESGTVDFEAMFHRKHDVHEGVIKFNMKPKTGIKYLREVCGLEETPEATAKFLLTTEGLDKVAVGEYLGEGADFNKSVLYVYVDSISFADMSFDNALRKFLSYFWLPGEAQKIDRMMEKFAERYCSQNEGVFAHPDTAYVLAYSLIMLNTDAHSSQIKKKMTQQEFVNMNRGINDSGDLPTPFLESLYLGITTNEIKIKQVQPWEKARDVSAASTKPSKSKLFNAESAAMVKHSQELFKAKARTKSVYHSSRNAEHLRPMLEGSWCAILAACSSVMEEPSDQSDPSATIALRGFSNAVHIAAEFNMATERDAFVTMLAKYTYLESTKAMRRRNIESFKTLVSIALADGNHLGSSWAPVLKCISEGQRLHMIGTGAKTDTQLFFPSAAAAADGKPAGATPSGAGGSRSSMAIIQSTRPRTRESADKADLSLVDELNSLTMVEKVDVVAIDRIFSSSAQLRPDAIVEFVAHLCAVAREELSNRADPQVYSLQKIVEIAYYNMPRVRLVWARIWEVLGEFFIEVGQNENLSIALYAVDSLRQLAMKFLEKGELHNYQFQREFLKPFQDLMAASTSMGVKELILGCLGHMVQSRAQSIRSGWRPMLAVLALAASDEALSVTKAGFSTVEAVITEHGELLGDHHVECVACVCEYASQQRHESISLQAADRLLKYLAQLRKGPALVPQKLWWVLLQSLTDIARLDPRLTVRKAAIESTFALLGDEAGVADGALDGEFGARVFRELLLPLLGPPATEQDAASSSAQAAWARSTGIAAVVAVERLFCAAHAQLDGQLEELVAPLVRCLHQREHGMAQVAAESLLHLVKEAGASFERDTWTSICSELKTRFVGKELPVELSATESNGADPSPLLREVSAKVEAEAPPGSGPHELQVLLLSTVFQLMQSMYSSMKLSDVEGLLNCMHDMYDKAHRVVQAALQGEVRPSPTELDEALHLQLEAARYFLEVLLDLFGKMGPGPHDDLSPSKAVLPPLGSEEHVLLVASTAEHRLVSFGAHVLRDYLEVQRRSQDADADQGELARTLSRELTPNVLTLLKGILEFHGPQFTRCARTDAPPPHCTAHAPRYLHDPRAGCATHAANRHSATLPHRASRAQASPGLLPPLRGAHALRRGAGEIGVARHPLDARRKHAARSASLRILDLVSCARRESATRRAQLEVGKG